MKQSNDNKLSQLIFTGLSAGLLFFASAHAAHAFPLAKPMLLQSVVQCTFDNCSIEIAQGESLTLSCEDKMVYQGPYELNTEHRTIQIECPAPNGLKITTQSLPTLGYPTKATLSFSGKQMDGICTAD